MPCRQVWCRTRSSRRFWCKWMRQLPSRTFLFSGRSKVSRWSLRSWLLLYGECNKFCSHRSCNRRRVSSWRLLRTGFPFTISVSSCTYNANAGGRTRYDCTACDGGSYCEGSTNSAVDGACKQGYYYPIGSRTETKITTLPG